MTCPGCRRTMPDTTPAEILILRATNAELHARLSELLTIFAGAQSIPQPTDPAAIEEIRTICRKAVAMRGATWRDGEPPAGVWVLRERLGRHPFPVLTFDAGAAIEFWTADSAEEWGTARWCPIVEPT